MSTLIGKVAAVGLICGIGTALIALYHQMCVGLDLARRDRPRWLPLVGPFAVVLPKGLTKFGRTHFVRAVLWLLITLMLIAPFILLR